ncbi:MAG TPA: hypothetical protein VLG50_06930 [Candidatus Saccharimonadales bacterium]|nr:hypothetical protein [Candidatus Saccharimonadales bacterium]
MKNNILMILVAVAVIALAIFAVRQLTGGYEIGPDPELAVYEQPMTPRMAFANEDDESE